MKKICCSLLLFAAVLLMANCDYDDSNDIDILKPNDSTETGIEIQELSN